MKILLSKRVGLKRNNSKMVINLIVLMKSGSTQSVMIKKVTIIRLSKTSNNILIIMKIAYSDNQ